MDPRCDVCGELAVGGMLDKGKLSAFCAKHWPDHLPKLPEGLEEINELLGKLLGGLNSEAQRDRDLERVFGEMMFAISLLPEAEERDHWRHVMLDLFSEFARGLKQWSVEKAVMTKVMGDLKKKAENKN